jgi:hypothetical protein
VQRFERLLDRRVMVETVDPAPDDQSHADRPLPQDGPRGQLAVHPAATGAESKNSRS